MAQQTLLLLLLLLLQPYFNDRPSTPKVTVIVQVKEEEETSALLLIEVITCINNCNKSIFIYTRHYNVTKDYVMLLLLLLFALNSIGLLYSSRTAVALSI